MLGDVGKDDHKGKVKIQMANTQDPKGEEEKKSLAKSEGTREVLPAHVGAPSPFPPRKPLKETESTGEPER